MRKQLLFVSCFMLTASALISCGNSESSSNEITKDTMPSQTNYEGSSKIDSAPMPDSPVIQDTTVQEEKD